MRINAVNLTLFPGLYTLPSGLSSLPVSANVPANFRPRKISRMARDPFGLAACSQGSSRTTMSSMKTPIFRTLADLEAIPPPTDKPAIYARHESEPWFGCCIMRPKKNGDVTRQYFVRLGDERKRFAHTAEMSFTEARKEAKRLHAEYEAEGKPATYTLRQLWQIVRKEKLRAGAWSETTLENYERFVPPEGERDPQKMPTTATYILGLWDLKLGQCTTEKLQSVLDQAEEEIQRRHARRKRSRYTGRATITSLGRWLHMMFEYAVKENWLRKNPMSPLSNKGYMQAGEPRAVALRSDDIPAFWSWLHSRAHPAARDFILVCLFMGLRRSVVANLKWEQIDIKRRTMLVPPNVRGNKRRKWVVFPIPDYLMEHVFLPRWNAPDRHPVWVIESNKRPGEPYKSVRTLLSGESKAKKRGKAFSLLERTGISLSPHAFRRTGATWVFTANGGNMLITKRFLSHVLHSSLVREAVTTGYVVTEIEQMREAMNKAVDFALKAATQGLTEDARAAYDQAREIEGVGIDTREARGGSDKAAA